MGDSSELERLLDALYVAVRDGAAVDRQAAFDIAMNELEYRPLHVEARELAEASVSDDDETRLGAAAVAFLDAYGVRAGVRAGARAVRAAGAGARRCAGRHAGDQADRGDQAGPAGLDSRQHSRRDVGGRPGVDERNLLFRFR